MQELIRMIERLIDYADDLRVVIDGDLPTPPILKEAQALVDKYKVEDEEL